MANFVTIRVPNISLISRAYDRIAVYRADAYNGTYNEITAVGDRIVLDPSEITYVYHDAAGLTTSYYRYQFISTLTGTTSAQSEQFRGENDIAIPILTAEELRRNFLHGIPLEDGNGIPLTDDALTFYINAATTYAQKAIDIIIQPTQFFGVRPEPADVHDYYKQDYGRYMWLQLLHVPVISIDEVRFTLPGSQPVAFDDSWIRVDNVAGVVQVVPGAGQSAVIALGLSTMWLPMTQGLMNFIPEVFEVDYTAGFADNAVPADIKLLIGYLASVDVLAIIGDILFGPGVAGSDIALDLLQTRLRTSRSDKASIFGARIKQYMDRARELINEQRLIYKGVRLLAG